jgi:hypothetical protein
MNQLPPDDAIRDTTLMPSQNGEQTTSISHRGARSEFPEEAEDDLALLAAWECLLDCDQVSTEQKKTYRTIRSWAIMLSVIATGVTVLASLDLQLRLGFLLIALVTIPILGFVLQNYDALFVHQQRRSPVRYISLWLSTTAICVIFVSITNQFFAERGQLLLAWAAALGLPFLFFVIYNYVLARLKSGRNQNLFPQEVSINDYPIKYGFIITWLMLLSVFVIFTTIFLQITDYQLDAVAFILRIVLLVIPIISVGLLN